MPYAYEGNMPYVFVSYSHKDSGIVMPVIESLQKEGVLIWFDGGIEAGSEWPEYIAAHLKNCACVLTFISGNFVSSDNCKRELIFAQNLKKPLLNIFIDSADLTDGMRMQLALNQALYKKNFPSHESFCRAICRAQLLQDCKASGASQQSKVSAYEQPSSAEIEKTITIPATKRKKNIVRISSLLEVSYTILGALFFRQFTSMNLGFFALVLISSVPHIALSLINMFIFRTVGSKLSDYERNDASTSVMFWGLLSTVAAVIVSVFYISYDYGFFVKLLISLGLNLLPTTVVFFVYVLGCSYKSRE